MLDSTVVCRRALGCEWGEEDTDFRRQSVSAHAHTCIILAPTSPLAASHTPFASDTGGARTPASRRDTVRTRQTLSRLACGSRDTATRLQSTRWAAPAAMRRRGGPPRRYGLALGTRLFAPRGAGGARGLRTARPVHGATPVGVSSRRRRVVSVARYARCRGVTATAGCGRRRPTGGLDKAAGPRGTTHTHGNSKTVRFRVGAVPLYNSPPRACLSRCRGAGPSATQNS